MKRSLSNPRFGAVALSNQLMWLLLLFCVIAAAAFIWLSSTWGLGTTPDSIHYLSQARTLLSGGSVFDLGTKTPPLYPLVLQFFAKLSGNLPEGARYLHALLYAINVLLFAAILYQTKNLSNFIKLIATCAFVSSPVIYGSHFFVYSEAIFCTCLLMGMLAYRAFLDSEEPGWLFVAAILFGLGILARYAAVAFVGGAAIHLLLDRREKVGRRTLRALVFTSVAVFLPALWLASTMFMAHGTAPRSFSYHPIGMAHLEIGRDTLLGFFGSEKLGITASAVLLTVAIALIVHANVSRNGLRRNKPFALFSLILLLSYLGFLVLSISIADFYTPLDGRMLMPAWSITLIAIALAGAGSKRGEGGAVPSVLPRSALVVSLLCIVMFAGLPKLGQDLRTYSNEGVGYFRKSMRTAPILGYLSRANSPRIYSNAAELIEAYFPRTANGLPVSVDPVNNQLRPTYQSEMDRVVGEVLSGEAIVVHFTVFAWREYLPGTEVFGGQLRLPTLYDGPDGLVYGVPKSGVSENQE